MISTQSFDLNMGFTRFQAAWNAIACIQAAFYLPQNVYAFVDKYFKFLFFQNDFFG